MVRNSNSKREFRLGAGELPMMPALANLKPEPLWKHFDRLASIPRASTKEAAAREYVQGIAKSWAWKLCRTKWEIS